MLRNLFSPRRRPQPEAEYEDFRETLAAAPAPSRYQGADIRRPIPVDTTYLTDSPLTQIVRMVSAILNLLLVMRFATALFTSDRAHGLVNLIFSLTDWLARPFQSFFGTAPIAESGYLDLPALAALVIVLAAASLLTTLLRQLRPHI